MGVIIAPPEMLVKHFSGIFSFLSKLHEKPPRKARIFEQSNHENMRLFRPPRIRKKVAFFETFLLTSAAARCILLG
jgi:hypothetical protein